jgi:hypothetical protein
VTWIIPLSTSRRCSSPWQSAIPEVVQHEHQIRNRPILLRQRMSRFAAMLTGQTLAQRLHQPRGLSDLGRNTTFVLTRHWAPGCSGTAAEVIVLRGYKACLHAGAEQIQLGGAENCCCAYDLAFSPKPDLSSRQVLGLDKLEVLRIGLDLDAAIEALASGLVQPTGKAPILPEYWLGFAPAAVPEVVDTLAARQAALLAVGPEYRGPSLPCLRSPGGTITDMDPAEDGVHILFDDTRVATLPPSAVLRCFVKVGAFANAGSVLGDFMPRRRYAEWNAVVRILSKRWAGWLLDQAVRSWDICWRELVCRRSIFVPSQAWSAARIFEVIPPVAPSAYALTMSQIQVWEIVSASSLCFSDQGVVANFKEVRREWRHRFPGLQRVECSAR